MRIACVLALVLLAGCASWHTAQRDEFVTANPETEFAEEIHRGAIVPGMSLREAFAASNRSLSPWMSNVSARSRVDVYSWGHWRTVTLWDGVVTDVSFVGR